MVRVRLWVALVALTLWLTPLPAAAAERLALVVGIDNYAEVPVLQKARNDAEAVHAALEHAGFRSDLVLDADLLTLLERLEVLAERIQRGDEVVFFFAGHGVEFDGRNYLLPADVPMPTRGSALTVRRNALPVEEVIDTLQRRGARVSLLILDACRDNPFARPGTRSVGGRRGLALVEPPEGTFIVYSAGAGQAALDRLSDEDPAPYSVFTRSLLPRLNEPGMNLRDMVQKVREEVRDLASSVGHSQFPAVYDQLDGSFFFVPASVPPPPPPPGPGPGPDDACVAALPVWQVLEAAADPAALRAFADGYADICPVLATMAERRLEEVEVTPAEIRIDPPQPLQVAPGAAAELRSGPGLDHAVLGRLDPGAAVVAVARSGDWRRIRTDDHPEAWIGRGDLVVRTVPPPPDLTEDGTAESQAGETGQVSGPADQGTGVRRWVRNDVRGLNVRGGPGTGHRVIGSLSGGAEVQELMREGGWSRIRHGGAAQAWVSSRFLVGGPPATESGRSVGGTATDEGPSGGPVTPPPPDVTDAGTDTGRVFVQVPPGEGLRAYAGPGTEYGAVGRLPGRARATQVETRNGWSRLEYATGPLWVRTDGLRRESRTEPQPQTGSAPQDDTATAASSAQQPPPPEQPAAGQARSGPTTLRCTGLDASGVPVTVEARARNRSRAETRARLRIDPLRPDLIPNFSCERIANN